MPTHNEMRIPSIVISTGGVSSGLDLYCLVIYILLLTRHHGEQKRDLGLLIAFTVLLLFSFIPILQIAPLGIGIYLLTRMSTINHILHTADKTWRILLTIALIISLIRFIQTCLAVIAYITIGIAGMAILSATIPRRKRRAASRKSKAILNKLRKGSLKR